MLLRRNLCLVLKKKTHSLGGFSSKIKSVKLLFIVIIVFKRYSSTYCLMQGSCFICSKFDIFTLKLESQPLSKDLSIIIIYSRLRQNPRNWAFISSRPSMKYRPKSEPKWVRVPSSMEADMRTDSSPVCSASWYTCKRTITAINTSYKIYWQTDRVIPISSPRNKYVCREIKYF